MIFKSEVSHMSRDEIVSEKLELYFTARKAGTFMICGIYWQTMEKLNLKLIAEKFKYYHEIYNPAELMEKV